MPRPLSYRPQLEVLEDRTVPTAVAPPDGIIAWWPGDGDTTDIIGGYDGSLVNGATFATGEVAQAFSLNGSDQYVAVGGDFSVQGARTIEGWVYASTNTGYGLPIMTGGVTGEGDFFGIAGTDGTAAVGQYELYIDHWNYTAYDSNIAVTPNAWNHVAMTYDGSTVRFYVNGVAGSDVSGSLYNYNINTYDIGGNIIEGTTTKVSMNGLLDEVTLYNRALSASEIQSIYDAGPDGKIKLVPSTLSPFSARGPLGALTYEANGRGRVASPGEEDSVSLDLDAGQTLSVAVTPRTTDLRPSVSVTGPDGLLATLTAGATGQPVVLQTLPVTTPGTYTISVRGADATSGGFTTRVLLNGTLEGESFGASANDMLADAQDMDSSAFELDGTARRLAAAGSLLAPDDQDWYKFTLAVGESATLAATAQGSGSADLEVYETGGALLASGDPSPTNVGEALQFTATTAGTYYGRVRGSGEYTLVVTASAAFDLEDNSGPKPWAGGTSQMLGDAAAAVGAIEPSVTSIFVPSGSGGLDSPTYLTFGPDSTGDGYPELYVVARDAASVLRYNGQTGQFLDVFVAPGSGGLSFAHGLAFGPDGNLYVSSSNSNQVLRYDGVTGAFLGVFVAAGSDGLNNPLGLFFAPGNNLYVVSGNTNQVLRYDARTGDFLGVFASGGGLDLPHDLVFGPDVTGDGVGELLVCSADTDTVARFNGSTGAFIDTLVAAGSGGLDRPTDLLIGPDGKLYVVGNLSDNVLRYDATTGAFLDAFAPAGTGGLVNPVGLTFGPDGNLYVASLWTNSVLRSGVRPDFYKVTLTVGQSVSFSTATPFDGPFQPVNTLDPVLRLYDAAGNLLATDDDSHPDGHNAILPFKAPADGDYFLEVGASGGSTTGEYVLTLTFGNVAPVNTVPSAQATNEDTPLIFSARVGNSLAVSDRDAGTAAVQIRLTVTNGTLTLGGTANLTVSGNGSADVTVTGPLSAINAALDGLRFDPTPDFNGTATLQVATDDLGNSGPGGPKTDTDTVRITVNPVNDAPSFTLAGDVTVDEDSGAQSITNFAGNFRPGPASATDEVDQELVRYDVVVLSTTGSLNFASGPALDTNGTLTFRTLSNTFGTATMQVTAVDSGPGTFPNVNKSATRTFTMTVNPVNHAPTFTVFGNVPVNEDAGPQTVHGFASNLSAGPANESGQHLTFFRVAVHVFSGNLAFTSAPVIDLSTGDLTFTAAPNSSGMALLDITLSDDGGTDWGGADTSSTRTVTLIVWPVNDAPLFDLPGDVTINEDAGAQTLANFATNFRPGPSTATDEAGQTLVRYDVTVLSTTGGLTFASGPAIDTNGTLTFRSDANVFGTATVQVTAVDSGPGTPPNVNSASKTFTLTVNSVNDAPSFTLSGDVTVNEDAGPQRIHGFARNLSAGAANESGQHLTFRVVVHITSGNLTFTSGPAIDLATGNLTFTTAADSNGTASVDVTLTDDGGTDHGGVDTSLTRTFTLTLRAVNDAPLFDLAGNVTVNEDAGSKTVTNFATNFRPGPSTATDEASQTLVRYATVVLSTTGPLTFTTAPIVSADGTLTFTAAPNAFGTAKVRVAAIDSGPGTPPDVNTATRTFTLTVNPINDPPTAKNDAFVVTQGRSKLLDVLSNDTSAPDAGESLTIVSASQGSAGGAVAIDSGTALRYTPHKSGGTETFSYTIADDHGGTATATVTVTVVPPPPGANVVVTGTEAGALPHVIVRDALTGAIRLSFLAYVPTFVGGVRVATGDLTGDGIPDIITGTGPGTAPHVKVFDGRTGVELFGFLPYGSGFTGGVFVAAGDVNGDGTADLITGTDAGVVAQVEVFSGRTLQLLGNLLPYGAFPGGARVAAGDVNGDGFADVITGAGPGAGPDVRVFDGRTGLITASFMAFGPAYPGGVYVAAGDLDGDGFADILVGAGTVAQVNLFSGRTGLGMASFLTPDVSSGAGLVTAPVPGPSGVRVAVANIDGDGLADILTGAGGAVREFKGTTLQELDNFFAYGSGLFGGLFLGGG